MTKRKGTLVPNGPSTKHLVIIGSHAAAHLLPSFRPFVDWDVMATPQQAIDMIRQQEQENSGLFRVKLIKQPMMHSIIKRTPMPADVQERIHVLPFHLYKISGKAKGSLEFEIEVVDYQDPNSMHSSAVQLLNYCNNAPPDELVQAKEIVAPLELLEALKASHICWPAYFEKHIADLHLLRAFLAPNTPLASTTVNMGYRTNKNKPLTPPVRLPQVAEFLAMRALEVEAFRNVPNAHIDLKASNEDALGGDNNVLITRYIPHDDIHTMVMYGDESSYNGLTTDTSNTVLSQALFEQTPYEEQLHCAKEEAMVTVLERFLLPQLTKDQASAYCSALVRICTRLKKGWFRQFVMDNFPRLSVCDKDLLSIRDAIL